MQGVARILRSTPSDRGRWHAINYLFSGVSHHVYRRRGKYGHTVRQKIRRYLWKIAAQQFKACRKYSIPWRFSNLNGSMKMRLKLTYRVKTFFRRFF